MHYDLLVIGGDPAGYYGAVAAARLNKRTALVDRPPVALAGATLPSASIRTAALRNVRWQIRDRLERETFVENSVPLLSMDDVRRGLLQSVERERAAALAEFERRGIDVHAGTASFADDHSVFVSGSTGTLCLAADRILVTAGTRPGRSLRIPYDGRRVFDTDDVLRMNQSPRSMIVIGGSVLGVEYAVLFAALGTQVTLVDSRDELDAVQEIDRSFNIVNRLGAEAVGIDFSREEQVSVLLNNGERLPAETVLFAAGRVGDTGELNLEAAGLRPDERGRLWCNENQQTWVPHIYGAGDVVGFPQQKGTDEEQAERAIRHAFGRSCGDAGRVANLRELVEL